MGIFKTTPLVGWAHDSTISVEIESRPPEEGGCGFIGRETVETVTGSPHCVGLRIGQWGQEHPALNYNPQLADMIGRRTLISEVLPLPPGGREETGKLLWITIQKTGDSTNVAFLEAARWFLSHRKVAVEAPLITLAPMIGDGEEINSLHLELSEMGFKVERQGR
jgi:hypothetical protein